MMITLDSFWNAKTDILWVAAILVVFQFFIPFAFAMVSSRVKERHNPDFSTTKLQRKHRSKQNKDQR